MKPVATNKKAYFDYQILENWEAGIVLLGVEIKAIRSGRINISGSYIRPFKNSIGATELWWVGSHFTLGAQGDETRTKKVLLNREQIERIQGKLSAGEFTLLPLELYLSRGLAKLKIGLAVRKKKYDKRELIKKKDSERDLDRQIFKRR